MMDPSPGSDARPAATKLRYLVLLALCLAAMVSYISRNSISVAEEDVRRDLCLTKIEMGWVMSAFFLTYALFQIPCARICEARGSRRSLAAFAIVWSLSTACLGFATGLWSLIAMRLLMGVAQAGLFPGSVISIGRWLPTDRRAFASGSLASSMSIGGVIAASLTGALLGAGLYWRWVFVLFVVPGLVWAWWFRRWFRDRPDAHAGVNEGELELIRDGRDPGATRDNATASDRPGREDPIWRTLLTSRPLLLICGQQFFRAAGYIFYATWFPTYLKETANVTTAQSGFLASLPLLAVVVGSPLGGALADRVWRRTRSRRWSRQLFAMFFLTLSAALVVIAYLVTSTPIIMTLITASSFSFALAGPCSYTITIDMGGRHVASVFSTMNMCGNIAAMITPLAIPVIVEATGEWNHALLLVGGIYLAAAVCWALLDPNGSIFDSSPPPETVAR